MMEWKRVASAAAPVGFNRRAMEIDRTDETRSGETTRDEPRETRWEETLRVRISNTKRDGRVRVEVSSRASHRATRSFVRSFVRPFVLRKFPARVSFRLHSLRLAMPYASNHHTPRMEYPTKMTYTNTKPYPCARASSNLLHASER